MLIKELKTTINGIDVFGFKAETSEGEFVCDGLSTDRAKVKNFCVLLSDGEPSLKQIPELVEDFFFV